MGMTANLQQRPRKRPTRLDRGSMTRSNAAHPPAYDLAPRNKPREASRSIPIHRDSLCTYAYYLQLKLTHPSAAEFSARSTRLHLSVGKPRFRPKRQRTGALHDAGAFAVPLKITRPDRRSMTRSNAAHPPALHLTTHSTTQDILDRGGKAQRRHRFRPHRTHPNHQTSSPAPSVILLPGRASASSLTISLSAPPQKPTTA